MTADDIKKQWEEKRTTASSQGTRLHNAIERYYNAFTFLKNKYGDISKSDLIDIILGDFKEERELFKDFEMERETEMTYMSIEGFSLTIDFSEWEPYRTEWCIFDEDVSLAGTIDMMFRNGDNYIIVDWKRCPEFKMTNSYEKAIHPVLSDIPNTNYWHYTFQLNTYRHMLKRKYGIIVKQLFLVGIHPDNPKYQMVEIPILEDTMEKLFSNPS
jgi:ATP-dependent exoDNAse (exonuclease V) beta subunit